MNGCAPSLKFTRVDGLLVTVLLLTVTLALQWSSRSQGFTRDEGYYFQAAELHVGYLEESLDGALHGRPFTFANRQVIDRWHDYNSEHPPLMKTLFGLSWRLLHRCDCLREKGLHPVPYARRHRTLGLLRQGEAMRLPAHILTGMLCAGVYLFGVLWRGRAAGCIGAALTLLQPRLYFHAQLACFDAPVAAMIFLCTLAYLWLISATSRGAGIRRGLLFGAFLGLGLLTKHNMFFLPPVLWLHSLWIRRDRLNVFFARSPRNRLFALFSWLWAPWMLYAALVAPVIYFVGWPHLWPAPIARFAAYVGFHLHHVHYNIEYLGKNYNRPPYPWHYVPLMTLLTAPSTTIFLAGIGIFAGNQAATGASDHHLAKNATWGLVGLGVLWPMLLIMRPGTPIFGAEKHWLPTMPFIALFAGAGFAAVCNRMQRLRRGVPLQVLGVLLGLAVLLPGLFEVWRAHPYGLSHYNALAGGPAGGADLGMNRQFWGYAVRGLMPTLNKQAPPHAAVYFHDANWPLLQMSMKDGFLRRDLGDSGLEEAGVRAATMGLVVHEKHFNKYEYWIWNAFATTRPIAVLTHEGVPITTLYARMPR